MSKRVLVAPLNWGLGHATRCIPIIQELLRQGAEVILASDGRAYELLRHEFPTLTIEKLPAYDILYQTNNMLWNMSIQWIKIVRAIYQEHRQLQKLIQQYQIDCIIADNRFGCFSRKAKSVFITHQIHIQLPDLLAQWAVRFLNRFFIRQFDICWIPDITGENSIAGALARPALKINYKYVGILSRMKPMRLPIQWDVIIVLSGPEPQRTRLEQAILRQIPGLPYRFLLVQGKPEALRRKRSNDLEIKRLQAKNVEIIPFLDAKGLNEAMAASEVVICRSGYSTIMDLAVLGKSAIFIPTPGQTEQEYLAEQLFEKGIFYYQNQQALDLAQALQKVKDYSGLNWQDFQHSREQLRVAVQQLLASAIKNPQFISY